MSEPLGDLIPTAKPLEEIPGDQDGQQDFLERKGFHFLGYGDEVDVTELGNNVSDWEGKEGELILLVRTNHVGFSGGSWLAKGILVSDFNENGREGTRGFQTTECVSLDVLPSSLEDLENLLSVATIVMRQDGDWREIEALRERWGETV